MDLIQLSPCTTTTDFEWYYPIAERHINIEEFGKLGRHASVYSHETSPFLVDRKTLSQEELDSEIQICKEFIYQYLGYFMTACLGDLHRMHSAYCWHRYKDNKPALVTRGHFIEVVSGWVFGVDEEVASQSDSSQKPIIDSSDLNPKLSETDTETVTEKKYIRFFDETQMNFKKNLLIESIYARQAEHYYSQHGTLPNPDELMYSLDQEIKHKQLIMDSFCEVAREEESFASYNTKDDFYFSFENEYFIFTYGKSVYMFKFIDNEFYLKNERVNMKVFFSQLRDENKNAWKSYIRINKLFESHGINHMQRDTMFYVYRLVKEDDYFYIRYNDSECYIKVVGRKYYRSSGDEIYNPSILIHELISLDKERKKANLKAKQFFKNFLTKKEKQELIRKKSVLVNGSDFDFIFCPSFLINPIIRINKKTDEMHCLCVMVENPYIPRYDVLASAMLLVKSGEEEKLNEVANAFDLTEEHLAYANKHTKQESSRYIV